jgi:hypothetical protein
MEILLDGSSDAFGFFGAFSAQSAGIGKVLAAGDSEQ